MQKQPYSLKSFRDVDDSPAAATAAAAAPTAAPIALPWLSARRQGRAARCFADNGVWELPAAKIHTEVKIDFAGNKVGDSMYIRRQGGRCALCTEPVRRTTDIPLGSRLRVANSYFIAPAPAPSPAPAPAAAPCPALARLSLPLLLVRPAVASPSGWPCVR